MFRWIAEKLHGKELRQIDIKTRDESNKIRELTEALERKEQELYEQNKRLNSILESQTDCIARVDCNKRLIYANTKYAETFCGTQDVDVCAKIDFIEHVHPDDRERVLDDFESVFSPPHRIQREHRVIISDGTERWFHWQVAGICDARGCVCEVQAVGRDITERKRAEERMACQLLDIQKKNRVLEVLIYATGGYLWYKDHDGKFIFCDRKFRQEFFGLRPGVDNCGFDDLQLIKAFRKKYNTRHDFGELCVSTDVHSMEQRRQCKYIEGGYIGDRLFVVEVIKTPHFDTIGRYMGTVGVAWDRSSEIEAISVDIDTLKKSGRCITLSEKEFPESPFVYWLLPNQDYEKKTFSQSVRHDIPMMEQRRINQEIIEILGH